MNIYKQLHHSVHQSWVTRSTRSRSAATIVQKVNQGYGMNMPIQPLSSVHLMLSRQHYENHREIPATGLPLSSFGPVQVPYTETQSRRFREVHREAQTSFHSYAFAWAPVYLLTVCPISPHFVALVFRFTFKFLLLTFCTCDISLQKHCAITFLLYPCIFDQLRYPIPL